jgi:hypothetical protein
MRVTLFTVVAVLSSPVRAFCQTSPTNAATQPLERTAAQPTTAVQPPTGFVLTSGRATLTLMGYVESYWQFNFNLPANNVTAWRGFDVRHNTFTLSTAVVGASWSYRSIQGNLALQFGQTPELYYGAEPRRERVTGGAATNPEVWKLIQYANVGIRVPGTQSVLLEAGLFLSPIGNESMAMHDNWNLSRSNLFYGLPYYHTGLRLNWSPSERHRLSVMVSNGWNSIVDNNIAKSISVAYTYTPSDRFSLQALYFGGIERDAAEDQGVAWRSLFDFFARARLSRRISVMVHGNVGFEPNKEGTNAWAALALYGRFELSRSVRLSLRTDFFYETAPRAQLQLFWPVEWMSSHTATLEFAPVDHAQFRIEYRHDIADGNAFYGSSSLSNNFTSNTQDTLTAGLTAWF